LESAPSHVNCLKTRRFPPVGCTLSWAFSICRMFSFKRIVSSAFLPTSFERIARSADGELAFPSEQEWSKSDKAQPASRGSSAPRASSGSPDPRTGNWRSPRSKSGARVIKLTQLRAGRQLRVLQADRQIRVSSTRLQADRQIRVPGSSAPRTGNWRSPRSKSDKAQPASRGSSAPRASSGSPDPRTGNWRSPRSKSGARVIKLTQLRAGRPLRVLRADRQIRK